MDTLGGLVTVRKRSDNGHLIMVVSEKVAGHRTAIPLGPSDDQEGNLLRLFHFMMSDPAHAWCLPGEPRTCRREGCGITFGSLAEKFLAVGGGFAKNSKTVDGKTRETSRKEMLSVVRGLPKGFLALDVGLATQNDVLDLALWMKETKGLSASTVRNRIGYISSVFKFAMRDKTITENPAVGLGGSLPRVKVSEQRWADIKEKDVVKLFTTEGAFHSFPVYLCSLVCLLCGIREGEARALQLGDWDRERNSLVIAHSASHDCVRGDTKTGGVRYVPLPQPLPEILGLLDDYPRDAFLMRERNSRPCATSHLQKCFYDALRKACGIDGERRKKDRITFHSLRHTAITYFRTRCGNDLYTNLVFGHETEKYSPINDRYTHENEIAIESVREIMEGIFTPEQRKAVVSIARKLLVGAS